MSARQQGFQENECFQKLRLTEFQTDISGISRPISINRVLNTNLTSIVSQLSKCAEPTNSKSFGTCLRANLCQILKSKSATKLQLNNRIGLALFILSNHFISFELIHQELIQNWFYYSVLNKLYFCVIGLKRFFFLAQVFLVRTVVQSIESVLRTISPPPTSISIRAMTVSYTYNCTDSKTAVRSFATAMKNIL